jgi:hypothetical protein
MIHSDPPGRRSKSTGIWSSDTALREEKTSVICVEGALPKRLSSNWLRDKAPAPNGTRP